MYKAFRIVLLFLIFAIGIVVLVGCKESYEIREGYTTVVLRYAGAEGKDKEEVLFVEHDRSVTLPEGLQKEGYGFVGWKHGELSLRGEWNCEKNDLLIFEAIFERDYGDLDATCAVWDNKGNMVDYPVGDYPNVNVKVMDVVVKPGYKATFYSKRNFGGRADVVAYRGNLNRRAHAIKVEKIESDTEYFDHALCDDDLADLLREYAPKIWWDKNEIYYASTVEDGMQNMTRTYSSGGYYYNLDDVGSDPFFGNDENCENLFVYGKKEGAKLYAFAVKKAHFYLALCYYIYEPFNYGKTILGKSYGNHIGDWEHVAVGLHLTESGGSFSVRPLFLETSYHSWRDYIPYDTIEREGKRPVAYIANRSHGTWATPGTHTYINILGVKLRDECSKGYAWDTRDDLETYAYDALTWTGRGIGGSDWNPCFDRNYQDPDGTCAVHWGNKGLKDGLFYKHFVTGPTGPEQKRSLTDYYTFNVPQTYGV